jgi:hypothetical protein
LMRHRTSVKMRTLLAALACATLTGG